MGKREGKEQGILLKQSPCWDFNTESTGKFSCLRQNSLLDGAGNFYRKNREFGRENREFNPRGVGRLFFGPATAIFRNNIRLQCLAAARPHRNAPINCWSVRASAGPSQVVREFLGLSIRLHCSLVVLYETAATGDARRRVTSAMPRAAIRRLERELLAGK